ncbi:hypothetical protein ABW20_dc0108570 [Dactylellina cionopaga]|nr:hypothetical protein ABW20_dc0108570 [Dactylellina cionopaga]
MSALYSLPFEVVNMITEGFNKTDFLSARMVSKEFNTKFRDFHLMSIYGSRDVYFTRESLENLVAISGSEMNTIVQHLIIRSKCGAAVKGKELRSLLSKACSNLPNIRSIVFKLGTGAKSVDYWKPVMDLATKAQLPSLETVKGPAAALQMSALKLTPAQLKSLQPFPKLRRLKLTTVVQYERPESTQSLYTWIEKVGPGIEELNLTNSRTSYITPTANADGGFLPSTFQLPNLTNLKLDDVYLTFKDIKNLLKHPEVLKELVLQNCLFENERQDCFQLLKHLTGAKCLRRLRLILSRFRYGISDYTLPNIEVLGNWGFQTTKGTIKLPIGKHGKHYVARKCIRNEANAHNEAEEFWEALTNGKWRSRQVTRQKRINTVERNWVLEQRSFGINPEYFDDCGITDEINAAEREYENNLARLEREEDSEWEFGSQDGIEDS